MQQPVKLATSVPLLLFADELSYAPVEIFAGRLVTHAIDTISIQFSKERKLSFDDSQLPFRCHQPGMSVNNHDIDLPEDLDERSVAAAVEATGAEVGLCLTMKTSLKKYPGCTHWHFKKPGQRGVLEVTWWPGDPDIRPARLWLSVHGNRQSDWISELMPRLRSRIEDQLKV